MDKEVEKLFVAIKAFIVKDGKVLILREDEGSDTGTNPGKYDFPGGKLELGETPEECLIREVREETGLEVEIGKPFYVDQWQPVVQGEQWQIVGIYYECWLKGGDEVKFSHEHDSFKWIDIGDYENHNLMKEPREAFKKYLKLNTA
ncbi:MAG: NUDIX domain-containing protein [Candidatus Moranbacteria bacterium]|nr:NUDIX domain-containing protein [Candidatus Moranbacteria bacterium]